MIGRDRDPAVEQAEEATLGLRLTRADTGARAMTVLRQDPPWRVVRSFRAAGGEHLVHLHNLSGGVLSGDRLRLEVELEAGAHLQLTTTGATRIYRHRSARPAARSVTRMRVGGGGLLEYLPDQLIPYSGSIFEQDTRVELADDDAGLFWWEILTPGRLASGESFLYDRLRLEGAVISGGRPVAMDRFCLEPKIASPRRTGALGPFSCSSTFYICRTGQQESRWAALEQLLMAEAERLSGEDVIFGASRLVRDGLMVRGLGVESSRVTRGLVRFWSLAKRLLYARDAVLPRKVY